MSGVERLLESNRRWAARVVAARPTFFADLTAQQSPRYFWIGCSDSRVPANEIVDLAPGEMFVHRNVANVVVHTDLNCLSVLEYAVDALKVEDVILCGHYGCGGVRAAFDHRKIGLIDNWLRHVQDVDDRHRALLQRAPDADAGADRLCELNVLEQARNVCGTTVVQDAWARGQKLTVHGWIYGLRDGLLRDIGFAASRDADITPTYDRALAAIAG